jgi:hypothetical protein
MDILAGEGKWKEIKPSVLLPHVQYPWKKLSQTKA